VVRITELEIVTESSLPDSKAPKNADKPLRYRIFRPDWKKNVFDIANVQKSVHEITKG
jgi:hypothetical protein